MDILGHSQISLTLGTYSHVIPAMRQEVASKMDEILAPVAVRVAVNADTAKPN
jgi:integrase